MSLLFSPSYWFTLRLPDPFTGPGLFFLLLFVVLVVAGIALRQLSTNKKLERNRRSVLARGASACLTLGIVGVLHAFFAYELVRFFGARFWYVVLVLVGLAWLARILWFVKKQLPQMVSEEQKRAERNRYLPGRE